MNLELLDPFAQDHHPEYVDSSIEANALVLRFNPSGLYAGQYIACGRADGYVSVIYLETGNVVRFFEGHVRAVTSIGWSRNGRYIFSASRDWNMIIWDLSNGERRATVRFDAPITSAVMHPRTSKILLVTLQGYSSALLVDLRTGKRTKQPLQQQNLDDDDAKPAQPTTCRFNTHGTLAYVGTSQGHILIFDCQTQECVQTVVVSNGSAIRHLEFNNRGTNVLVNSNDRVLRLYNLNPSAKIPDHDLIYRFQDVVGRTPWNSCKFSRDGEYVVAGAGGAAVHNIFIWDSSTGTLSKILEGPKEPLMDFDWHPIRPLIASVSNVGLIHKWVTSVTENWSAYAPGFEELEENLVYLEREDEFDVDNEVDVRRRKEDEQNVFIDITTLDRHRGYRTIHDVPSKTWADSDPDDDTDEEFFPTWDVDDIEQELLSLNSR